MEKCKEYGLLIAKGGYYGNVMRVSPMVYLIYLILYIYLFLYIIICICKCLQNKSWFAMKKMLILQWMCLSCAYKKNKMEN